MAREKFLVVRPDGVKEKSKSFDKIDSAALSYFAPVARTPSVAGFDVYAGSAYIGTSFVSFPDTFANLGTGGNFQTSAMSPNYYNVVLFSVSDTNTLVMTQGTPAATLGGVGVPSFPPGNLPICSVNIRDNGSGSAGSILPIVQSDITEGRPFFYSSYGKSIPASQQITDFKPFATSPVTTGVTVNQGYLFFNDGNFQSLATTTIHFGTGEDHQAPSIPSGQYNKALLVFNSITANLDAHWGTPNAVAANVILPPPPGNAMPIAIITVKDNGSALPGTILPIQSTDIQDVRPFFNNLLGSLPAANLDYVKVTALFPYVPMVRVLPGLVYPKASVLVNFPGQVVDFSSGPDQNPAIPAGYFQRILVTIAADGSLTFFRSAAAASQGALVDPPIPKNIIPLAFVDVHDDGSAVAGSILPITPDDIKEARPFLGQTGAGADGGSSTGDMYEDYLTSSTFLQGFYEDFSDSTYIDPSSTATVDTIVNSNTIIGPSQVLLSLNVFDNGMSLTNVPRVLIYATVDTETNLLVEASNDGGTTWASTPMNSVLTFATMGTDLRVRFTNTGVSGNITVSNWAVFYNDDEISPSFLFANERLSLYQEIDYGNPNISGNTITLLDGRAYPIGENALLVFKNGSLQIKDDTLTANNSYREVDLYSIQVNPAPALNDVYVLVIPAGYFGQDVSTLLSSVNQLISTKHIVDQLVRSTEGTATDIATALNNLPSGGRILVESANWAITSPLLVTQPIYLYAKLEQAKIQCQSSYAQALLSVSTNNEFTLENMVVTTVSGTAASATGLLISGASANVVVKNCTFSNLGTAISVTGNCQRLVIRDSVFSSCGIAVSGADNVVFENCVFQNLSNYGAQVMNNSVARGCKFINCSTFGLQFMGAACTASDNYFSVNGEGLVVNSAASECVVSNNQFFSHSTAGMQVDGDRCVISGNVSKLNQVGLLVNGSENAINSNVITDNSSDGIVLGLSATNNAVGTNVLLRNP